MFILLFFFADEPPWSCKDGDALYTPTVELVKGNKKILVVGFIHYGPKSYFQRQRATMQNWIGEADGKVTILTELYTCRSSAIEIKNQSVVSGMQIDFLARNITGDMNSVNSVMGNQTLSRDCLLDVDGVNYRPAYVVERNRSAREEGAKEGLGMQWDMQYPRGQDILTRSGDVVMDHQSPASQFIGSLGYHSLSFPGNDAEQSSQIYGKVFDWYMVGFRNSYVTREAMQELETKDRVIIPWGGAHRDGIEKLLIANGFTVARRKGVRFGAPSDQDVPETMKENIKSYSESAVPMASLCANQPPKIEITNSSIEQHTAGTIH